MFWKKSLYVALCVYVIATCRVEWRGGVEYLKSVPTLVFILFASLTRRVNSDLVAVFFFFLTMRVCCAIMLVFFFPLHFVSPATYEPTEAQREREIAVK